MDKEDSIIALVTEKQTISYLCSFLRCICLFRRLALYFCERLHKQIIIQAIVTNTLAAIT